MEKVKNSRMGGGSKRKQYWGKQVNHLVCLANIETSTAQKVIEVDADGSDELHGEGRGRNKTAGNSHRYDNTGNGSQVFLELAAKYLN